MRKFLSQLSGGFDSMASTLLSVQETDVTCHCVFFNYGQRYMVQEKSAAQRAFALLKSRYPDKMGELIFQDCILSCGSADKEEYIAHRNLILATISLNIAYSLGCQRVVVGSKGNSYADRPDSPNVFRDSSIEFFKAINEVIAIGTEPKDRRIYIDVPLYDYLISTKKDVLQYLQDQEINLDDLWTCYNGANNVACGVCFHCEEYKQALAMLPQK